MATNSNPLLNHPRYEKIKTLGSGAFGTVLLCKDKEDDRFVAIKLLNRGLAVNEYVSTELLNHRRLHHPHIIKMREVFLTTHHLCIVLEYADQGDMFTYVTSRKHLDERMARWMFQQLIVGLDYLHRMNICSRDIKLENTLVKGNPDNPVLKICDFGYSKSSEEQSQAQTTVGTVAYMAPEVATQGRVYDGMAADIWSCGVMLYVMLVGRYPFERPEDERVGVMGKQQRIIQRILARDVAFPSTMSAECVDLLDKLLTSDPTQRIGIAQIQAHPWYLKHLPSGVLGMNESLLAHRVPEAAMEAHKAQLTALVAEAKKRLPYNAPRLPYKPIPTPLAPAPNAANGAPAAAPIATTAAAATPVVAPPVTPPAPPAAAPPKPPPATPLVVASVHLPAARQAAPVYEQPKPQAAPYAAAAPSYPQPLSSGSARPYVPYPSDRFAPAPVAAKHEGMLASSTRHSLSKCKEMLSAARKQCKRLFAGK